MFGRSSDYRSSASDSTDSTMQIFNFAVPISALYVQRSDHCVINRSCRMRSRRLGRCVRSGDMRPSAGGCAASGRCPSVSHDAGGAIAVRLFGPGRKVARPTPKMSGSASGSACADHACGLPHPRLRRCWLRHSQSARETCKDPVRNRRFTVLFAQRIQVQSRNLLESGLIG